MSKNILFRLGGIAALLSGFFIISGKLLAILHFDQAGEMLDFLSPLFGLFAATGLYLWQRDKSGLFGFIAFIILFIGLSLVICLDYFGAFILIHLPKGSVDLLMNGPSGPIFVISGIVFLIGEILFGILVIKVGVFSKTAAFLFIIGFIPVPLVGVFPVWIVSIGSVLAGVGLCWWGITLYTLSMKSRKKLNIRSINLKLPETI